MGHSRTGYADMTPAMNSADRSLNKLSHRASPAEVVDDFVCLSVHDNTNMRYSQLSQEESCDNRFCDIRISSVYDRMDIASIKARADKLKVKQADIARATGIDQDKISKMFGGTRQLKAAEAALIITYLDKVDEGDPESVDNSRDYLSIEILPSYAGMGGGGTGEGDVQTGLVPRAYVENELRAKPSDLLLIEARGESMEPDFLHGDQILIDKRDCNPIQPGSFALWDGDGYVIKLIERVPHKPGWYRIFSANGRYSAYEVDAEQVKIMGRPVWFARRL